MSSYLWYYGGNRNQPTNQIKSGSSTTQQPKALRFHLNDQDVVSIARWKKEVVDPALIELQRGTRVERYWRTVDGEIRPYEGPSGGIVSYYFIPGQHLLVDTSGEGDTTRKGTIRVDSATGQQFTVRENIEPNSYFYDWITIPPNSISNDQYVVTVEEQEQIKQGIYSTIYPMLVTQQQGTPFQDRWIHEENGRIKPFLDPNELPMYEFAPTTIGTVKIFKYFNQQIDYSNYDEW